MQADLATTELLEVAESAGPLLERAHRLLEVLERRLSAEAAWMTLSDPTSQTCTTVRGRGAETSPLRAPGADDHLEVPLRDPGGPVLGCLHLRFTGDDATPVALRERISSLAPLVARGVSPLRPLSATARLVPHATCAAVLLRDGGLCALPGLADHPLLVADSPAVAVARRSLLAGHVYASFMWPARDGVGAADHLRLTVLSATEAPSFVLGTVVLAPDARCRGLTARELQVLGLLVDGRSNQQIARHLTIAERTAAAHVEHILHKLDTPTRTLAAVEAERTGCYVPPLPCDPGDPGDQPTP